MPQIFQVLRCYKCFVFQVHQTKKSNKWECKLCGEKQSIKRHYGIGTAKDCRLHVQKLNTMRGDMDNKKTTEDIDSEDEDVSEPGHLMCSPVAQSSCKPITSSKWSNFLDEPEIVEEPANDNMKLGDAEVVFEIPKKQRKAVKRQFNNSNHKDYENHKELSPPKIVPISNTSSKLKSLPLTSDSENLISQIDCTSNTKPNAKKKFIPPIVNKNSKWAQFTEETEECADTECTNTSQSLGTSQNNAMFSLYDDTDLDNLLNI
ncbi:unnamed protein product [Spodoptera littoralis]|uniref:MRN complex-interacting protein N-terminal domain-containing protein n=1 Tax=Spodoptera littoralis TaxID=7109 RepID=A0A9P0IAV9_SPOLI|nr:unnamed protein product [Spodoptera littoralis]CAH1643345.1 unnamed protein product [Spodoptera littoralis]